MFMLVCRGAKYSYFLLFLFVVPFVLETEAILTMWLKVVPEYTPIFMKLAMFGSLATLLGNSMILQRLLQGR